MTKIEEMKKYCDTEQIFWFCDLVYYAMDHRRDWLRTLKTDNGSKTMGIYLAAKAHRAGLLTDKQYEEWLED